MIIKSDNFNVDKNGNMTCKNATITGGTIHIESIPYALGAIFSVAATDGSGSVQIDSYQVNIDDGTLGRPGRITNLLSKDGMHLTNYNSNQETIIETSGIETPVLTQTSLESKKKNFEKFVNALDIIKQIDIYKYNLKSEKDTDKKHIGFVIGDKYKYAKEVTNKDNTGVDDYSFISLCCKAIQEQQELIEKQNKTIENLTAKVEKLEKTIEELTARVEKLEQKAGEA